MLNRDIICIDLKSFFASCECIDRGLDPFTTPLVVANKNQGDGAITLAITPYLKTFGIESRTRLFKIPKNIKYIIAKPRMSLYIKMSKEVIKIYLKYVAPEDLHVYSVDEAFLDLTSYLNMYQKTSYEIAQQILKEIEVTLGLTATCGIGPNMLLAKVAMDTEAKKYKNGIALWTYDDVKNKLWNISPLSKMWGIGYRMEKNLNNLGIFSVKDLALYDKNKLKDKYGVIGEELWNNANGIDESIISKPALTTYDKSYSLSQILFKDYNEFNIKIIIQEMVETICMRLRKNNKCCYTIGFGIGYSKNIGGGFFHHLKLDSATDKVDLILKACLTIFDKYYEDMPIRKVSIALGRLQKKDAVQLNIFESVEDLEKENSYNISIDEIKNKFGNNSLLKASSLLGDSTIKDRNTKIGGHSA